MKLLDCKHREMVCNALEPCDFQEFADNDVGIVFCSLIKSEQSIRQDEREKVLKLLEAYIKEFKFEYNGDNGFVEDHISVDHLEKWFIEELRQEGKEEQP